jgi:endonuclease-3
VARKKRNAPAPAAAVKARAGKVARRLAGLYPDAECALRHENPLQLLVATILSAQCTDARVNLVTPALFARYPDARAFAEADADELQSLIKSTGFFRNKARNIIACCRKIVERHGGQVPGTLDELVALDGIGRKTANVVLGDAFGVPGITVDTHVGRLSRRLGLSRHADPHKVERDLMSVLPPREWTEFSHRMIFHGRQVCHARKPRCEQCTLKQLCPRLGVRPAARSPGHGGGTARTTSSVKGLAKRARSR